MFTSAESRPQVGGTLAITAVVTLAAWPMVPQGPLTSSRLIVVCSLFAVVGSLFLLRHRLWVPARFPQIGRTEALFGFILAAGIIFRLRALFASRSLWFDEVSLALNIRDRSLIDLLTLPLTYRQSAPPGFLTAAWLSSEAFGMALIWVRFVPFVAGILALWVGLIVAKETLRTVGAQAFFLVLLAWSPLVVFYATELKQYSTDALAMTLALYVAHLMFRQRSAIRAAVLGFLAIISSTAGVIVFFLLALIVLVDGFAGQRLSGVRHAVMQNLTVLTAWLSAALLHVLYTAVAGVDRVYMQEYWGARGGFAPQQITGLADAWWYVDRFSELLWLTVEATEMVGPGMHEVRYLLLIAAAILVFGAIRNRSQQTWPSLLVAATGITAVVLSYVRLYPLSSRLAIYLIPALAWLMAYGVDYFLNDSRRIALRSVGVVASVVVLGSVFVTVVGQFQTPYVGKDMHAALQVITVHWQPGDEVWAVPLDVRVVEWHRDGAGFTAPVVAVDPTTDLGSGAVAQLSGDVPQRLWIVSSTRRREARMLFTTAQTYYDSSAVYANDDTFIALLSTVGPVTFELTDDRRRLIVR